MTLSGGFNPLHRFAVPLPPKSRFALGEDLITRYSSAPWRCR